MLNLVLRGGFGVFFEKIQVSPQGGRKTALSRPQKGVLLYRNSGNF